MFEETTKYKYCNKPSSFRWVIKDVEEDINCYGSDDVYYINVGRKFGKTLDLETFLNIILKRRQFINWWSRRYYWNKYSTKFPEHLFYDFS